MHYIIYLLKGTACSRNSLEAMLQNCKEHFLKGSIHPRIRLAKWDNIYKYPQSIMTYTLVKNHRQEFLNKLNVCLPHDPITLHSY